ncbi:MAG: hypothetical protein ACREF3_19610 [Acetobacteraceae bacterium]
MAHTDLGVSFLRGLLVAGLAAIAVVTLVTLPGSSPGPPAQITSDTPTYCLQLLDQVSELAHEALGPPPAEVLSLASDGRKLCEEGKIPGGILRLRRAMMLLTSTDRPETDASP